MLFKGKFFTNMLTKWLIKNTNLFVTMLYLFCTLQVNAQFFKTTQEGFIFVKDTLTEQPLSNLLFHNVFVSPSKNFTNTLVSEYYNDNFFEENEGKYFQAYLFFDSLIVCKTSDGWGCIDINGNVVYDFKEKYPFLLYKNGKYVGYHVTQYDIMFYKHIDSYIIADTNINSIIARYGAVRDFYKGTVLMNGFDSITKKKTGLYGLINLNLDTIVPFENTCTSWDNKNFYFSNSGLIAFANNNTKKCGILNYLGDTILPFEYDYIDDPILIDNNDDDDDVQFLNIIKDNKYGLIKFDENNKVIWQFKPEYDYIVFNGNTFFARKDSCYFLINKDKIIFDTLQSLIFTYDEFVMVKKYNKWGMFNSQTQQIVLPYKFDTIIDYEIEHPVRTYSFLAYVGNDCYFYNSNFQLTLKLGFDNFILCNKLDLLITLINDYVYLIRNDGTIISEPYEWIDCYAYKPNYAICSPFFIVQKDNKVGIINDKGEVKIPIEYDALCDIELDYSDEKIVIKFLKNNEVYIYESQDDYLFDCKCDDILLIKKIRCKKIKKCC